GRQLRLSRSSWPRPCCTFFDRFDYIGEPLARRGKAISTRERQNFWGDPRHQPTAVSLVVEDDLAGIVPTTIGPTNREPARYLKEQIVRTADGRYRSPLGVVSSLQMRRGVKGDQFREVALRRRD